MKPEFLALGFIAVNRRPARQIVRVVVNPRLGLCPSGICHRDLSSEALYWNEVTLPRGSVT